MICFTRQRRFIAHRQLVRWCWKWLGKEIRVKLPACAVNRICVSLSRVEGIPGSTVDNQCALE